MNQYCHGTEVKPAPVGRAVMQLVRSMVDNSVQPGLGTRSLLKALQLGHHQLSNHQLVCQVPPIGGLFLNRPTGYHRECLGNGVGLLMRAVFSVCRHKAGLPAALPGAAPPAAHCAGRLASWFVKVRCCWALGAPQVLWQRPTAPGQASWICALSCCMGCAVWSLERRAVSHGARLRPQLCFST